MNHTNTPASAANPATPATTILGLRAMGPVHVGTEDLRGVIDLAIQREKHNNWPVVFASSVKGALRELAASQWQREHADLVALFGPDHRKLDVAGKAGTGKAASAADDQAQSDTLQHSRAGALLVNEMRLLALPVASLSSVFKWVTCPAALQRLLRDCRMFRSKLPFDSSAQDGMLALGRDEALSYNPDDPARLFVREYLFQCRPCQSDAVLKLFCHLFGAELESELRQRLLIVSDARFGHLAQTATAIAPHIALNENKTTEGGMLWFEETLPSETLMYLPLACEPERLSLAQQNAKASGQSKHALLAQLLSLFEAHPFLRVGANETTGMGWFGVHLAGSGSAA